MSSIAMRLLFTLIAFFVGVIIGIDYHQGKVAEDKLEAVNNSIEMSRLARQMMDAKAMTHTQTIRKLSTQLGDARATIAKLESRDCLDPGTVGVLNSIGMPTNGATTSQPQGQAGTAASNKGDGLVGLRYSTNKDLADALAICRAGHEALSSQLNQILDIEDRRAIRAKLE